MVPCLGPSRGAVPAAGPELGMGLAPGMSCGPEASCIECSPKPELGGVQASRDPPFLAAWLPDSPPARRVGPQLQPLCPVHLPLHPPQHWCFMEPWDLRLPACSRPVRYIGDVRLCSLKPEAPLQVVRSTVLGIQQRSWACLEQREGPARQKAPAQHWLRFQMAPLLECDPLAAPS